MSQNPSSTMTIQSIVAPTSVDVEAGVPTDVTGAVTTIVALTSNVIKTVVSTNVEDAVIHADAADTDSETDVDIKVKIKSETFTPAQHSTHQEQPMGDSVSSKENNACPDKKKVECPVCHQLFVGTWNRRRHLLRKHPEEKEVMLKFAAGGRNAKCLMCQEKFSHVKYLKRHLTTLHDVQFDDQEITFNNEQEFLTWKKDVEKSTDSVYVVASSTKPVKKNGEQVRYFSCNRSGNYRERVDPSRRKRRSKTYGTVKLDSHCTSIIKMISRPQQPGSQITVQFCATHYGHQGFEECRKAASEKRQHLEPKVKRRCQNKSKMIGSFEPETAPPTTMVDSHMPLGSIDGDDSAGDKSFLITNSMAVFTNSMDVCGNSVGNAITEHDTLTEGLEMDSEDNTTLRACLKDPHETVSTDVLSDFSGTCGISGGELNGVENGVLSARERYINSLQTFVNVIERCQTDGVLDLAASGIEELTSTFIPLLRMELSDTDTVI